MSAIVVLPELVLGEMGQGQDCDSVLGTAHQQPGAVLGADQHSARLVWVSRSDIWHGQMHEKRGLIGTGSSLGFVI